LTVATLLDVPYNAAACSTNASSRSITVRDMPLPPYPSQPLQDIKGATG
jgi:hypothetical protein